MSEQTPPPATVDNSRKTYLIGHNLAQAILNHLGTQPYAQVHQFIAALQTMPDGPELPAPGGSARVLKVAPKTGGGPHKRGSTKKR